MKVLRKPLLEIIVHWVMHSKSITKATKVMIVPTQKRHITAGLLFIEDWTW